MKLSDDRKYFIGVEGGATKGTGVVMDAQGNAVYQFVGGPLNYRATGKKVCSQNLAEIIASCLKYIADQGGYLNSAVFGLAGMDYPKVDEPAYNDMISPLLDNNILRRVVNDSVVNMHARCEGLCSIIIISGTGSNAYGENGDLTWFGSGDGHLAGDEGSGFDAGNRVIHAAVSSWRERIPHTLLQDGACKHAGVNSIPELEERLYQVELERIEYYKSWVASFSRVLDDAIDQGDYLAIEIRAAIADELVRSALAVFHHCRMELQKVCISLVGSNFKMPGLKELVEKKLRKVITRGYFSDSEESGAVGAARMAMKLDQKIVLPHD